MAPDREIYQDDSRLVSSLQKLRFFPLALTGGNGCSVIDEHGRALLDLSAGWGAASLGYGYPALVAAIEAAARNPAGASILSASHRDAVNLADDLLATHESFSGKKVWFGHSGSDANETAARAIAAATGRPRVIAFRGAYHGGTAGSMAISGHSAQSHAERSSKLHLIDYPDPYRGGDGQSVLNKLAEAFATWLPAKEVGALFIEPIQSDGGVIVPPPGFLRSLSDMCQRAGILVVSDEVKVGMARSGRMHCFEHEGFVPDLVCLGKGLGGGLPISALIGPPAIMDHATAFAMQTLQGNPVCVAAARAVLDTIARQRLSAHAEEIGAYFASGLRQLQGRHAIIGDVRSRGLALGIELVSDPGAKTPSKELAAKAVYRAFELGLVIYYVGPHSNVLELTPPLVLTRGDVDRAIDTLDRALTDVSAGKIADATLRNFTGW